MKSELTKSMLTQLALIELILWKPLPYFRGSLP